MSRIRVLLVGAVAALVAAAPTTAGPSMAPAKLNGSVGPGFTIFLKKGSAPVRTLKAGRYTITVSDKSNIHDFHLKGPGVNRVITGTPFKGTKSVTVTLKKGTYTYVCDPHASTMKKTFRVT
ncbi:MAG TPA: plastocyanin/azurin family copper-binding protein [Gaiellaceae bacterium]|nr:plastocyanin/azurin family copper-binding protein [Gaiellaceae bacterium]